MSASPTTWTATAICSPTISPRRYFCDAMPRRADRRAGRWSTTPSRTSTRSSSAPPEAARSAAEEIAGAAAASSARRYWAIVRRPSAHFSLGFLIVGGFIAGIVFWGGFNTAMELTNTETFCTGCHEMRDNVFAELQRTIHFTNRTGVRAICSGLPRAARLDRQDRAQDAGVEGGVGQDLRHASTRARSSWTSASSSRSTSGRA